MKNKDLWALDWLRFSLALYIVFYHTLNGHYEPLAGTWIEAVLDLGNIATTIFFVVSGFLLTHVYVILKGAEGGINKKAFFVARFSSLYPLHLIGIFLALIPALLTVYVRGGISVPAGPLGTDVRILDQLDILLALFSSVALLNAWNPYYLILNGPSWSLSALACYYVLFPFIAPTFHRMKSPVLGLVILGILFSAPGIVADLLQRTDLFTEGLLHRNPVIRLPLFLSGMVLCVLFSRVGDCGQRPRQLALLGLIVVATFIGAATLRFQGLYHFHFIKNGLYLPAALAAVWICASAPISVSPAMRYWGKRLGGASLPLFLLHVPLFQIFSKIERVAAGFLRGGPDTSSSVIAAGLQVEQALVVYPVYIITVIIVCVLLQEKLVVPTQARIKRYLMNDSAAGVPSTNAVVKLKAPYPDERTQITN